MKSVVLVAAALLALGCGRGDQRRPAPDSTSTAPDSANGNGARAKADVQLKLPAGFTATVFAENLGSTRHIVAGSDGTIYANTWRSPYDTTRKVPPGGYLIALRDKDGDGRADDIRRFGSTSEQGSKGGTGIALNGNELYAEADSTVVRYRLSSDPVPSGKPEVIVTGLAIAGGHPMHPIAVDARNLFVNMGSATNACQAKDREAGSKGHDPCTELKQRAGIWRFSHQPGQRFSPAQRYATGIRNAVGLALYPGNGTLYSTQHGRDQLAENWPKLYNWKQGANLPAEELLRIQQGGDYGWPYCYYDPELKRLVLAPEYGGDGKQVGRCASKLGPVAAFPAHWAPDALTFYNGTMFPQEYRGGAFIAFHGSWNRAPEPQEGYNVVFQPLAGGKASGDYRVFADGFAGENKDPGRAAHRPAGLTVGADGALYISDDQRGTIWRVVYQRP